MTDVEIRCLPKHLPEYLELDVTALELNQIYHLSDIKAPEGVTLVSLAGGHDHPVVAVNPPRAEEVDAPVEAATPAGEVPATAQVWPPGALGAVDQFRQRAHSRVSGLPLCARIVPSWAG